MDSHELIEMFYNQTYEKFVNKKILDDKNYIVPRQQLINYVHELVNIPFGVFIDHLKKKNHHTLIEASDITQFSSFHVCEIEMCKALLWANNPGCQYVDIGRLFPDKIISKSESAYRSYGLNHIKAATQLGLTFEYYDYWYLSCLGYIYPQLGKEVRNKLLARTLTRNVLYEKMLIDIVEHDINIETYLDMLPSYAQKRKYRSVHTFLSICLKECDEDNIKTHELESKFTCGRLDVDSRLPNGVSRNFRRFADSIEYISLSADETVFLLKKYRKGDKKAYNLLVQGYIKLVYAVAKSFYKHSVDYEDLVQEGVFGLINAFDRFNYTYFNDFPAYANLCIRQTIEESKTRNTTSVRIPFSVFGLHKKIWEGIELLEQQYDQEFSVANIEYYDNNSLNHICRLPENLHDLVVCVSDVDYFEDSNNTTVEYINKDYNHDLIQKFLNNVDEREQTIIKLYYGLDGTEETLESIGLKLGFTRERARQILVNTIKRFQIINHVRVEKAYDVKLVRSGINKDAIINKIARKKAELPQKKEKSPEILNMTPLYTHKIYNVFDNVASTYKYYWFISILQLLTRNNELRIHMDNILAMMVANAWPDAHKYSFGKIDSLPTIINKIQDITGLCDDESLDEVYNRLINDDDPTIRDYMKILAANVPYRFLTPWATGTPYNQDCLYNICKEGKKTYIVINKTWKTFLESNYNLLIDFSYQQLNSFLRKRNPGVKVKVEPVYIVKRKFYSEISRTKRRNKAIEKTEFSNENQSVSLLNVWNSGGKCAILDSAGRVIYTSSGKLFKIYSIFLRAEYIYDRLKPCFNVYIFNSIKNTSFSQEKKIVEVNNNSALYKVLDDNFNTYIIEDLNEINRNEYYIKVLGKWYDKNGNIIIKDVIDRINGIEKKVR